MTGAPSPEGTELTVAECRAIQLDILDAFHAHCSDLGLTYYLAYGSLLGAIRHGGYIPWDDDIDVMMPRSDYDRLTQHGDQISRGYRVHGLAGHPAWPHPFLKVSDPATFVDEGFDGDPSLGVYIDIFPIDVVPDRAVVRRSQRWLIWVLTILLGVQILPAREGRSRRKRALLVAAKPWVRLVSRRRMLRLLDRVARWGGSLGREAGVLVGTYQWSASSSAFGSPVPLVFEGRALWGPADTDEILRQKYGDYLTLPPEDKQVSHHYFRAFRR